MVIFLAVFGGCRVRYKCLFCIRTELTRYANIVVYVMCLYLDVTLKRYGYINPFLRQGIVPLFCNTFFIHDVFLSLILITRLCQVIVKNRQKLTGTVIRDRLKYTIEYDQFFLMLKNLAFLEIKTYKQSKPLIGLVPYIIRICDVSISIYKLHLIMTYDKYFCEPLLMSMRFKLISYH